MTKVEEQRNEGGARVARMIVPVPDAIQSEYEAHVLPALVTITRDWWAQYQEPDRPEWDVSASSDAGICVDAPDDDPQDAICCPRWLNDATLLIGWQRYRNASIYDPKREIAEKLIEALLRSELLGAHINIEHMDDVAEDLGLYQQGSDYESDDGDRRNDEYNEEDNEEGNADGEEESLAAYRERQAETEARDSGGNSLSRTTADT